ncbi:MAG: methyl-accepting chemotaxis protein [Pseudomonadota bacterium]
MMDIKILEEQWNPPLRAAGAKVWTLIEPELDRIMREIYGFLVGARPEAVTSDQIERGRIKFENILQGRFSPEYIETQRKTTRLLMEKGVSFDRYLMCYAIYHREGALCLARHAAENGSVDDAMFHALHRALQSDACVSMSSYFEAMEAQNTLERRELTAANNQKIMSISKSIGDFSTQTKMLAINAAIEAARAGDVGKGFAVVASQVKAVATKVQDATDEIAQLARAE